MNRAADCHTIAVVDRFETLELIAELRRNGYGWHRISNELNARGIPTRSGRGQWHTSSTKWSQDPTGWRERQRAYRDQWRRQ